MAGPATVKAKKGGEDKMKTEKHNVGSIAWCMMHNCFYGFRLHLSFILKAHVKGCRAIEMCMCCMQNKFDKFSFYILKTY